VGADDGVWLVPGKKVPWFLKSSGTLRSTSRRSPDDRNERQRLMEDECLQSHMLAYRLLTLDVLLPDAPLADRACSVSPVRIPMDT
jgi:hypothetical protein